MGNNYKSFSRCHRRDRDCGMAEMLNVDTKLYIKNYTYVFDA